MSTSVRELLVTAGYSEVQVTEGRDRDGFVLQADRRSSACTSIVVISPLQAILTARQMLKQAEHPLKTGEARTDDRVPPVLQVQAAMEASPGHPSVHASLGATPVQPATVQDVVE